MAWNLSSKKEKLAVWGYIRQIEKLNEMNIPNEIYEMIFLYQQFLDKWLETKDEYITLNDNKLSISCCSDMVDHMVAAVGQYVVKEGIFRWRIKILRMEYNKYKNGTPEVGIIRADITSPHYCWHHDGFQFCGGNGTVCTGLECKNINNKQYIYTYLWNKPDDLLEIVLDLNEQTLKLKLNDDKDYRVAFTGITKQPYRLAISCLNSHGEFLLL